MEIQTYKKAVLYIALAHGITAHFQFIYVDQEKEQR
jgi:hypothetical protein